MLFLPGPLPALLRLSFLSSWPSLLQLLLFAFSYSCGQHIKSGRAAHLFQNFGHCLGSIVELQDCKVGNYLHSPCTTKFFPNWAKTPHQTLVWLIGILCRAAESSLQHLFASLVHICRLDYINNVIRQGIMCSIGIFSFSFHLLAWTSWTSRFSTFLWCNCYRWSFGD